MPWEVEGTEEFAAWYATLDRKDTIAIDRAVERLAHFGPTLGRPLVDTIQHSRLPNLKELRPRATTIRILLVFDPRRTAILLLGGDKAGRWDRWYQEAIPRAERLYAEYLGELRQEGLLE